MEMLKEDSRSALRCSPQPANSILLSGLEWAKQSSWSHALLQGVRLLPDPAADGIWNPADDDEAAAAAADAEAAAALDLRSGRADMMAESSEFLRISLAVLMAEALELWRALEYDGALMEESKLDVEAEKELLTLSSFHCWPGCWNDLSYWNASPSSLLSSSWHSSSGPNELRTRHSSTSE